MNRTSIRNRIRTYLKDTDSDRYQWIDTTLNTWIDDVEDDIARVTEVLRSRVTAESVAGQLAFFDAPSYTTDIKSVSYNGILLPPLTVEEAYVFSPYGDWEGEILSIPMGVILQEWGKRRFRVYPAPPAALDASKFTIHISHTPTVHMTADNHEPQIPEPYHVAVVYGAVAHAYLEDFDMLHPEKAKAFMVLYNRVLGIVDNSAGNQREAQPAPRQNG